MAIRIVWLGMARGKGEGVRLGTVRRPPRGVKKADYAREILAEHGARIASDA